MTAHPDTAFAALTPHAQSVYLRVGVLPVPTVHADLVAAACATTPEQAAGVLQTLHRAGLLDAHDGDGRSWYAMDAPVREHAQHRADTALSQDEREKTLRRCVDWCLRGASDAEALLTPSHLGMPRTYRCEPATPPPLTDPEGALAWLGAHLDHLMAAVRTAHQAGWHVSCWQLVDALWPAFLRLRPVTAWLEAHQLGLASARTVMDRPAEVRMLTSGAAGLRAAGRYQEALSWCEQALTLAVKTDHRRDLAQAHSGLGSCYRGLGDLDRSEWHYCQALAIREDIGYRRGAALTRIRLAQLQVERARYEQAAALLEQAVGDLLTEGEYYEAARARALLGDALVQHGRPADGLVHLSQALADFRGPRARSSYWEALTLARMGDAAARTDQDAAAAHYRQALTLGALTGAEADRVELRLGQLTQTSR